MNIQFFQHGDTIISFLDFALMLDTLLAQLLLEVGNNITSTCVIPDNCTC